MGRGVIIVSACLVGICSRHDGRDALNRALLEELKGKAFVPLCPEQLGGLPTPRPRAELSGCQGIDVVEGRGRVMDERGEDVTGCFLRGAGEVLKAAELLGAGLACMKEGSPSCGVRRICREGEMVEGTGVTSALLAKEGIEIRGFD